MRQGIGVLLAALMATGSASAQVVRLAVDTPAESDASASIDTAGTVVYSVSARDPFGTNPALRKQIFRWNTATGAGTQVTNYEEGVESVSVSGDGTWLAFVSCADLLGTNHDESPELYVMRSDGTGLAQLTSFNVLLVPLGRGIGKAVISGSANRIVFTGKIDPFGTNPAFKNAVFVIDRNGSNLKQLAIDVEPPIVIDISDDGSKVIYSNGGLVGVNANGTGLHQFYNAASVTEASISGNGAKVVYAMGTSYPMALRARTFDGNPLAIVTIGNGSGPSITDDATMVYHRRPAVPDWSPDGIYKISTTGGAVTLVSEGLEMVRVSGDGTRLVARNTGLVSLDNTGGSVQQLTSPTFTPATTMYPQYLSPDGNLAWQVLGFQLFRYDFAQGTQTPLTDGSVYPRRGVWNVSDGGVIVFEGSYQIWKLSPDGTLTSMAACGSVCAPAIRPDGQMIVYQATDGQFYRMNADGSGLAQITVGESWGGYKTVLSDESPHAWMAYPCNGGDICRIRTDGTGRQDVGYGLGQSISGDGSRIAWLNNFATGSWEVFLWDAATQAVTQLTHDQGVDPLVTGSDTYITRDGQWVFAGNLRINANTGVAIPATGFLHATSSVGRIVPNPAGTVWAFTGRDVIDRSASAMSLYRMQSEIAPQIQVSKASPTVVTWDPSPDALRYDVIRGSVSALSIAGSTVSLGPVTCLEDDSPDNHTRGFEDGAIPAPGEAFFFLYRGSTGFDAATGSYGQGSGGRERVAGAGGCN